MADTLRERQEEYENNYRFTIQRRLPIVIRANLRNYKRLTQNLKKSFCIDFCEIMANTMLYAIAEIQDAIFGFYYKDEVIFVLRNDKEFNYEPWYQNDIQKIVSTISSLLTIGFYRSTKLLGSPELDLTGEGIFKTKIFSLPYITEVINNLIWHQQLCMKRELSNVALEELAQKLGEKTANKILQDTSFEEKEDLLLEHFGINFKQYYPNAQVFGVGAYKVPTIISNKNKNKWTLNYNIPDFLEDKDFLFNIIKNGIGIESV